MRKLMTLLVSLVLALGVGEGALRWFTPFPIHSQIANRRPSEQLVYVADRSLGDIDARGFRNPDGLSDPELIALGDSHTYGYNVAREESWPAQAARILGLTVYNYGMGGYGVLQHLYLFDEALARRPQAIVLALYLANDLGNYCSMAARPYWRSRLAAAGLDTAPCGGPGLGDDAAVGSAMRFLAHSAILSALDQLVLNRLRGQGIETRYGSHTALLLKQDLIHHARCTDLESERIRVALGATEWILDYMAESARNRLRFGVLFVPSKENVLFESVPREHPLAPELARAVSRERLLTERLEQRLHEHGVPTASPLDCLHAALDGAPPLYPYGDGHPYAEGYHCYALAAASLLKDAIQAPRSSR